MPEPPGLSVRKSVFITSEAGPSASAARTQGPQGQVPEEPLRAAADSAEAAWLQVRWRGSAWGEATL